MLGARLIDVLHEPHLVTCLSTNAGDFFRQALRLLPPLFQGPQVTHCYVITSAAA